MPGAPLPRHWPSCGPLWPWWPRSHCGAVRMEPDAGSPHGGGERGRKMRPMSPRSLVPDLTSSFFSGSLVRRVKAKRPRSLKNPDSGRSPARSQAGRPSCAVRGEAGARGRGRPRAAAPRPQRALCCREELPTIYKCPYQGCTAVYRGADGMKVSGAEQLGSGPALSPSGGGRCCVTCSWALRAMCPCRST